MGMMIGAAVGQGFVRRGLGLSKAESEGPGLRDQLARSLLWRGLGPFESLVGKSGSPIELVRESEERIIIWFQIFEFHGGGVYTHDRRLRVRARITPKQPCSLLIIHSMGPSTFLPGFACLIS